MNFNLSPSTDWNNREMKSKPARNVSGVCEEVRGSFKGDKKKKSSQGSEYNLVDKTATTLSTGYIRFIASGSELRHVRGEGKDDWKWNPRLRPHSARLLSSLNTDIGALILTWDPLMMMMNHKKWYSSIKSTKRRKFIKRTWGAVLGLVRSSAFLLPLLALRDDYLDYLWLKHVFFFFSPGLRERTQLGVCVLRAPVQWIGFSIAISRDLRLAISQKL